MYLETWNKASLNVCRKRSQLETDTGTGEMKELGMLVLNLNEAKNINRIQKSLNIMNVAVNY